MRLLPYVREGKAAQCVHRGCTKVEVSRGFEEKKDWYLLSLDWESDAGSCELLKPWATGKGQGGYSSGEASAWKKRRAKRASDGRLSVKSAPTRPRAPLPFLPAIAPFRL